VLRKVEGRDVPVFFEQMSDPAAARMAAFTPKNLSDPTAFEVRWKRLLAKRSVTTRTIELDGVVVGHIACFGSRGEREITYWIGREYWGRGIGTRALALFLRSLRADPLYARAAADNVASIRVLEKAGFVPTAREKDFAERRGEEVEEIVMMLNRRSRPPARRSSRSKAP
jgi:RimJ/RimL family protein N-acetyltransferase